MEIRKSLNFSILAFSLVMLSGIAFAEGPISLSITPLGKSPPIDLAPYEVMGYKLQLSNSSISRIDGIKGILRADEGLAIITNGKEFREREFYVQSLEPSENYLVEFIVRADGSRKGRLKMYASYYLGENPEGSIEADVNAIEPQLSFSDELSGGALNAGRKGSLKVSLKNTGNERLEGIKVSISGSEGITIGNSTSSFEYLEPGIESPKQEFVFYYSNLEEGNEYLVLNVSYSSADGEHLLEKRYLLEQKPASFYLLIAAAIAVLLVGISYYLSSRKKEA